MTEHNTPVAPNQETGPRRGGKVRATFSEQVGDEVYIYVRGRLVMKRWLRDNTSAVFHVAPRGVVRSRHGDAPRWTDPA